MAEAILFNLAQNLTRTLASEALQAAASVWGFRSELQRLEATTNDIKKVILDAEDRQAEVPAVQDWLKRLKAVLYTADDLFDEYATLALRKTITRGNKCSKEVRLFFSKYNQIYLAIKVSRKIKKIRRDLDDIENDGRPYHFIRSELDNGPPVIRRRRDDDHSYIPEDEVIGREHDKDEVIRRLATEVEETVSVVCLVGMGGLGKTALAQLVYNDEKVKNKFDVRLWVCVSEKFDIKVIIQKILKSATNTSPDNLELDQLQYKLRELVRYKKYLLVLDDVWNESREEWLKLRRLLVVCGKGSRFLVTTRSQIVADIMTDGIPPYDLKGLAAEKSWSLFEKLAFKHGQEQQNPSLVKIGKEIVEKCGNVPLAIRALASYLYDQEEEAWLAVRDKELGGIGGQVDTTMEVLKLSYNHLWSPLKQCFAYCSVFPKDSTMRKEELVHLWIAQGFAFPSSSGQSLEDTGHDYFMQLLQRCFFQDVDRYGWGDIYSCKMHDLIHDLAQRVAGEETTCIESGSRNPDQGVRHLCFHPSPASNESMSNRHLCFRPSPASNESMSSLFSLRSLRTLLFNRGEGDRIEVSDSFFDGLFSSLKRLRVLEIRKIEIQTVPSSVWKLLHLRYLSVVNLPITSLPDSVQELLNLQTLSVIGCPSLTELPAGVEKLTSLRHLDLSGNRSLVNIAVDISKLTNLRHLASRGCTKLTHVAAISQPQTNLTFLDLSGCDSLDHMPSGVENLTSLRHLDLCHCRKLTHVAADISTLTNLTFLDLRECGKLTQVAADISSLTNLRHLALRGCTKLTHIAAISQPQTNLTFLDLSACDSLDHMPSGVENLTKLRTLRGFLAGSTGTGSSLAAINHLTALEELRIKSREDAYSDQLETVRWDALNRLLVLELDEFHGVSTLPVGLQHLTTLRLLVVRCPDLIELPEWIHCLRSLEKLEIYDCQKLECLPEEIRLLPRLKELTISGCGRRLQRRCAKEPRFGFIELKTGEDWPKIQHIPKVVIELIPNENEAITKNTADQIMFGERFG